jgi:hypothetical protein
VQWAPVSWKHSEAACSEKAFWDIHGKYMEILPAFLLQKSLLENVEFTWNISIIIIGVKRMINQLI